MILGYFIASLRRIICRQVEELPDWEDTMGFFSQGIIVLAIIIVYLFFPFLLILIGYILIGGGKGLISSEGAISFAGMIFGIIILIGFLLLIFSIFVIPMALAFYAETLSIMEALYLPQVMARIFDNIELYFMGWFVCLCVTVAVLSIFIFIFPLAFFYLYMFYAYIFGHIYLTGDEYGNNNFT